MTAPALPIPPAKYDQHYMLELVRTLRLYFVGQVDVRDPVLTAFSKTKTVSTPGTTLLGLNDGGVILANTALGAITLVLPAARTAVQYQFIIKRISATGAPALTITTAGGLIDLGASAVINTQFVSLTFRSDGTNYWIV